MKRHLPDRDLDSKATNALIEAQKMPPGPERTEALNKATRLRNAAETYGYLFSNELSGPKEQQG
jgi:hypothetical protein